MTERRRPTRKGLRDVQQNTALSSKVLVRDANLNPRFIRATHRASRGQEEEVTSIMVPSNEVHPSTSPISTCQPAHTVGLVSSQGA